VPNLSALDHGAVAALQGRLAPYLEPHLARRKARQKHPVHDFMFVYYSFRPAQLLTWSPGWRRLAHDDLQSAVSNQQPLLKQTLQLLRATATRPGNFGCFGLHEWAMVYRTTAHELRHLGYPLRLGHAATDAFVDSQRIQCSHFDAFRFFTPPARSLNVLQPGRQDRPDFEQPGCVHGNMDLYKHAFRLWPLVGSDLIADCFELAWQIRIFDMRAAPYNLTGLLLDPGGESWTPICIETSQGRREYAETQRRFAEEAAPLRQRLIDELAPLC
jgi:hypothetical protein